MYQEDNFVVVLPSNTPSSIPNTPSNYLTTFDQPFYLDGGQWEVALFEINFKNTIKTIHNDELKVFRRKLVKKTPVKAVYGLFEVKKHMKNENEKWYCLKDIDSQKDQLIYGDTDENGRKNFAIYATSIYKSKLKVKIQNFTNHPMTLKMPWHMAQQLGFEDIENKELNMTNKIKTFYIEKKGVISSTNWIEFLRDSNNQRYLPLTLFMEGGAFDKDIKVKYHDTTDENWECIIKPKPGRYSSANDLVSELNKGLKHFLFSYDPRVNRIEVKSLVKSSEYTMILENGLNDVLGFTGTVIPGHISTKMAEMEVNLMRGIGSLFVYCDICEPIRVGNTMVPLLRNVSFNSAKYGDMVNVNYNHPIYVKTQKSFVDKISIRICDATGDTIPFEEGLTSLVLHFRRL